MANYKKIGVMGGMGPETSAAFYQRIIGMFQTELHARHNYDFPEMVVHNVPSPDNVEAGVGDELLPYMINSVELLQRAGMDFIAIPCNSAHVHIDAVSKAAKIPVLNILEETAKAVEAGPHRRVLVLGTKSTLGYNLYPPHLEAHGIEPILPDSDDRDVLTDLIMKVCTASIKQSDQAAFKSLIKRYSGAQAVILGCTELPLVCNSEDLPLPVYDTLEILVKSTFETCIGKR